MTDRELLELLELAAKAGGVELGYWCPNNGAFWCGEYWNPDTDDGDALRLAVQLHINIEIWNTDNFVRTNVVVGGKHFSVSERYDPARPRDDLRATRRAIVRAAAEIGKGMK